ncbi:MAG: flagellar filament protein FlaA [Spirochaetales bacterium]|nr:flagellar filament protein FlaA [Spirochaetales bacterium]
MNKTRIAAVVVVILFLGRGIYCQDKEILGDRAQQILKEITVEQFEDPGLWYGAIPSDVGIITLSLREGKPKNLLETENNERLISDAQYGLPAGRYVLGAKIHFYKRSISSFSIYPVRPIPIEGITKRISVWVIGRNFRHKLKVIIEDFFGIRHELTMGDLTFKGWQKMTVTVPGSIMQEEYHYTNKAGIKIVGFKVDCDLLESYGTFYIYFDDLSAETDLFAEEYRDEDDVPDNW